MAVRGLCRPRISRKIAYNHLKTACYQKVVLGNEKITPQERLLNPNIGTLNKSI